MWLFWVIFLFPLALPLAAAFWLGYLARRCARDRQRAKWVGRVRWISILMLFEVPSWWFLCVLIRDWKSVGAVSVVPLWFLLVIPLSVVALIVRLVSYQADAHVFEKKWTVWDLFQLALWRTASSTTALLMVAVAMEALSSRSVAGFASLLAAGTIAVVGKLRLRTVEGLVPRPVKSGELYKRSLVLSKRMRVPLKRVCVVPFGRGHLTNAYGGRTQIAITDDYGHWLQGSQLDFVVGHELAHAKRNDGLKAIGTMVGIYAALAATSVSLSYLSVLSLQPRFFFSFAAILFPLLVFYSLSRRHEYVADRLAVEATREPETAIRALVGLYRHAEVPAEHGRFAELFSTHPGLWRRVDAIMRQGAVSPDLVANIRQTLTDGLSARETVATEVTVPPETS